MAPPGSLVGRAPEIAAAVAALDGALGGRTGALLVTGEAGIGKTRLLEELERLAGARAVPVLWGRATSEEGAPAYWPWRQVLRAWAAGAGADGAGTVQHGHGLGPAAATVARIAPEVAGATGVEPPGAAGPIGPIGPMGPIGAEERFVLFESVAHLLAAAAARTGLVVVLDDLHWADVASLLLLAHVLRHVRDARLLVAAAYRAHELAAEARPAEIVADVATQPSTVRLDLAGLSGPEVGEHLARVLGRPPAAEVVTTVACRTGGNPLFVQEVGRLLASGADGVPAAVRSAIGQRVGRLSAACRLALAAAAVVRMDIDPGLLAAVTGAGPDEIVGHLEEALASGLVVRPPASLGYRFAHDLVRECWALELHGPARARVHLAAAEHLGGPGGDGHPAEVAHHLVAALPLGDAAAASQAAARAGREALVQLAFEDAARLFGWALEAGTAAGAGAAGRARLLVDMARAHHLAHDSAAAMATAEEAATLARQAGDAEALGLAALVLEDTTEPDWLARVEGWCRAALDGLGEGDSALRARLLAQQAMTWLAAGDTERMEPASGAALAMAERVGEPGALATALRARQLARSSPDGTLERLALADRMQALGEASSHPAAAVWGHLWRFDALVALGRIDDAEAELARLEPVVGRTRLPLARWHLTRSVAAVHLARGRFAEGRTAAEEALAIAEAGGHPGAVFSTLAQLLHLATLTGQPVVDLSAVMLPEPHTAWGPIAYPNVAEWCLAIGRTDEAERLYRLMPSPAWSPPPFLYLGYHAGRAALAAAFADEPNADAAYRALLPHAGLHVTGGAGAILTRGSTEHFLGLAAATCGRLEAATGHLRRAVEANRSAGLPACTAESRYRLAAVLVRGGQRGDRAEAAGVADEAAATAHRLGMGPLAAHCEALLAGLADVADPLSPREREIADLVARGLTNREIAACLHIAHRTAENHVQHILTKLGFRTRSQVAAWAATRRPG
jgi:DNA-binding CsgD family transcriptional regulator/tetratricopeptide (TPR) repeat protein